MTRAWSGGAVGVLGLIALWVSATMAQARVSPWQRARDPARETRRLVYELGDHKREPRDAEHDTEATRTQLHKAAVTLLERALGSALETTVDVELLFLYGECLAYAGPAHLDRARTVLHRALNLAPDASAAASAWNTLGRVSSALEDSTSAVGAFEHALALEWDLATRNGIQIEQGLLFMRGGNLERSIERLTAARDATDEPVLWALAQWALGVAKDRALFGNEGALLAWKASQARFGANGELDVLALPGMAPDPSSDTTYYRALALMGKAQTLAATERVTVLLDSKFLWLAYLQQVGPTGPFVERVQYHLQRIDELTTTPEDRAELERRALAPLDLEFDAGGVHVDDMIWPEESTRGDDFWSGDAGVPLPDSQN